MSDFITERRKGDPQGYHDIDTKLDAATLDSLPRGHMQHHAFQPQLWRKGDEVAITTSDKRSRHGRVLDVSEATGNILIKLKGSPPRRGQESMPAGRMAA